MNGKTMMQNIWGPVAAILLVSGSVCAGQGPQVPRETLRLNLQEAVELGLEQNPTIRAMDFGIERSLSEVKSVRGRFLPRISAGYSQTFVESIDAAGPTDADYLNQKQESWRVGLQQPLYAGKTIVNTYQKARILEQVSRLEKESEERKLIRQIQEEFLALLKTREDRRSLEQTVKRLEVSHEAVEAFAASQMVAYVEVLQARVELEDARQQLAQAENKEIVSKTRLDALLGLDGRSDVSYIGDLADIDLHRDFDLSLCQQAANQGRTDLMLVEDNIRIAGKERDIAAGRRLPWVTFQLSAIDYARDYEKDELLYGRTYDRDQQNQYWIAGITVDWTLFSGGENYYRQESMVNEIKRLQSLYEDTAASIRTEVRTSLLRLQESRLRVEATRGNLGTAQEGYRMETERFRHRVGTVQGLLNAQDRLARAEANLNKAFLDYRLALADLYYAMGTRNYALD